MCLAIACLATATLLLLPGLLRPDRAATRPEPGVAQHQGGEAGDWSVGLQSAYYCDALPHCHIATLQLQQIAPVTEQDARCTQDQTRTHTHSNRLAAFVVCKLCFAWLRALHGCVCLARLPQGRSAWLWNVRSPLSALAFMCATCNSAADPCCTIQPVAFARQQQLQALAGLATLLTNCGRKLQLS